MASELPIVEILGAGTALFLSVLILSAVGRQATRKSFQKGAFLFSVVLLIGAVVSNIILTLYLKLPASDPSAVVEALVFSKKVQGTFDLLFAITIGAFVLATAKPEIDTLRAFAAHLKEEFPSSFLFYVFVQVLAIVTLWLSQPVVSQLSPPKIEQPTTFLFTGGLAWVTVLAYIPFMLLTYVRRVHARPSLARQVYFIILGLCGYAVVEFTVEVLLPYYAIDVRPAGFVIEMALVGLVAYAVRERRFLENLLMPQSEAAVTTDPAYKLERGLTYLILGSSSNHSFEIFRDLVTHGSQGLCLTRRPPKAVMQEYGLERTPVLWLSRVANQKNCVRPSPPENVAMAVEQFLDVSKKSVVLLDGLEYLVAHNDFSSILAMLHGFNEMVSMSESILLIPIDPRAVDGRELALLQRETQVVEMGHAPSWIDVEVARSARRP